MKDCGFVLKYKDIFTYTHIYICINTCLFLYKYIWSSLPSIESRIRHWYCIPHKLHMFFSRNPSVPFFFFKPIPNQLPTSNYPIWAFFGYYCLPSLGSNYFSMQISAVIFLILEFLQPLYTFYWCKNNLHSIIVFTIPFSASWKSSDLDVPWHLA